MVLALAAVVSLMTSVLPAGSIAPSVTAVTTLSATADATASEKNPTTNFGTIDYLRVRSSDVVTEKNAWTYLKFDLSSIAPGAKIVSATLFLYMYDPPSSSRTYHCLRSDSAWTETGLTWNNRPTIGWYIAPGPPSTTIGTSAAWVNWSTTKEVQRILSGSHTIYWDDYGWIVRDSVFSAVGFFETDFRSREYSDANYRPKLQVQYNPPELVLTMSATTLAAGNWVKMTVQRKDSDGNPITRGALNVDLSSTSTSPNEKFAYTEGGPSITTVVIPNGASSRDFYYYDEKVGTWTIGVSTSTYANYGSDSGSIQVNAGPPASLDLTPPTATMAAGGTFSPFTVTLKDAFGQTAKAAAPVTVNLATTSAQGKFRIPGTTTQITSVVIQTGQSSAQFAYYEIQGGTFTITVTSGALAPDTAVLTVIPDTVAPTTTLEVGTPKYETATATYVSGTTQITLSASDLQTGVKETSYRIDGGGWTEYSGPFTLATYSSGTHTIGYRSEDNALNVETEKTTTLTLDNDRPSVTLSSPSGDLWVSSLSVTFQAVVSDTGSGLASIVLILDGTERGEMTPGGGSSYSMTLSVSEGAHTWTVRARDNVANVQQPTAVSVTVRVDTSGPTISGISISPTSPTHGDAVTVSANIEDVGSGVRTAILKYSTDGVNWVSATMTAVSGNMYQGTIPGQNVMSNVSYYIQAADRMDNSQTSPSASYQVGIPMLWLIAGGGAVALLVLLLLLRSVLSRPSPQPQQYYPPPPG